MLQYDEQHRDRTLRLRFRRPMPNTDQHIPTDFYAISFREANRALHPFLGTLR